MKKRKQEAFRLSTVVLLILLVLVAGAGATIWYYAIHKVVHVQIYSLEIKSVEGKVVGFNADPTLHFGKISDMGGTARKQMTFTNDYDFPVMVKITSRGEAASFFSLEKNYFTLEPGESVPVYAYMTIPSNWGQTGNYTGEAKVTYLRI